MALKGHRGFEMSWQVVEKMPRTLLRLKPSGIFVVLIVIFCITYFVSLPSTFATRVSDDVLPTAKTEPIEQEKVDGEVKRLDRINPSYEPDLLWLVVTQDEKSWGQRDNTAPRTFDDFLVLIQSTGIECNRISLGLLTSSATEYQMIKLATRRYGFARVTVILHQGYDRQLRTTRAHRHDEEVQTARRAEISKLRNYLLLKALQEEPHIIWLDADVFRLDEGLVQKMISHSEYREDAGLITARCQLGTVENYDLNSWAGTRQGPRGWDLDDDEIAQGELKAQGQHHVRQLIRGTTDDDLIELDTVGATILYMRASLVLQGLSFPHQYTVGTRWGKDGWDGIESEGLCYRARGLDGGSCFVMGGKWHIEHTDH